MTTLVVNECALYPRSFIWKGSERVNHKTGIALFQRGTKGVQDM